METGKRDLDLRRGVTRASGIPPLETDNLEDLGRFEVVGTMLRWRNDMVSQVEPAVPLSWVKERKRGR